MGFYSSPAHRYFGGVSGTRGKGLRRVGVPEVHAVSRHRPNKISVSVPLPREEMYCRVFMVACSYSLQLVDVETRVTSRRDCPPFPLLSSMEHKQWSPSLNATLNERNILLTFRGLTPPA